MLWQGLNEPVLDLLEAAPKMPATAQFEIAGFSLRAIALTRLHEFEQAGLNLARADELCAGAKDSSCGGVLRAHGILALEQGSTSKANAYFQQTLVFARGTGDRFLEATALLNLSASSLHENHLDDAIDKSQAALRISTGLSADELTQIAVGNLGWAYYKLGDSEKALEFFVAAKNSAEKIKDTLRQVIWLTDMGTVYLDRAEYPKAEESFTSALQLAIPTKATESIRNALIPLALVYAREGKFSLASSYADEAIKAAQKDQNRLDELYPLLAKGQVAAQLQEYLKAEAIFREVASDRVSDSSLRWEAQHSLARLEEAQNHRMKASRYYQEALCTFETARSSVHREESKLPFFTNAVRIYDDYISFLIKSGETRRGLDVADDSRGRTLAEGLGLLRNNRPCSTPSLPAEQVAAGIHGTILYYWLGQPQSYLWAITSRGIQNFVLPPAGEIEARVRHYREALVNGEDVLASSRREGLQLYQLLVAPATESVSRSSRVIIIPDGNLTALNFESLLVPGPLGPHYWIEDAVISNVPSLRLLITREGRGIADTGKMLLIGDAVPHPPEFPELPNAKLEIQNIEKHFGAADLTEYTQASATAATFLDRNPEQYTYVHFVAHAVASSQVPLDSAVILSPGPGDDSFKLYARDIVQHHLRARLVTVSACYGAGTRSYDGEGLIGLSWAFLRAGARNTIGALWEVNDISTPQLMDRFYAELKQGYSPDVALRDAKLSVMRSNKVFSKPFYWAPFQLYGVS